MNTNLKKQKVYKIEVLENKYGELVLYLCKGKNQLWIGNLIKNRGFTFAIDVFPNKQTAKSMGVELDESGQILIEGGNVENKAICERLDRIEELLSYTNNI